MTKKLYVGNLDYATTAGELSELFTTMGEVVSVNLITDRMTGRSRGFAFIEMAEQSAADQAIEQLNGRMLGGRALKVAEARPQRRRDDFGYGRGPGGGGGRRGRRY
jgi:RNA recognition motif-containing protein